MIEIKKCTCTYASAPEHKAIKNIDLKIDDGEFVLLTGGSGCGKTTILRLLNGLIPHFYEAEIQGEVFIDGALANESSLYELSKKIGTVFQNPRAQFYTCDVKSELAFGCENQGIPEEEILSRMDSSVKKFSLENLIERSMFELSGGEKQQIACASIDTENTKIILLDEPSANLDYEAMERLKEIIRIWKVEGKTIVISEHRTAYLWDLCDKVVVMEEGRVKRIFSEKEKAQLSEENVKELGIRSFKNSSPFDSNLQNIVEGDDIMEFKNYRYAYKKGSRVFEKDSIKFAKGEITALIGHNGVGKSTLLNCLCGIRKCKGELVFDGKVLGRKQRRNNTFMIMQDVSHQLFTDSVLEEVLIGMKEDDEEKALDILKMLDLEEAKDRHPQSLSGGQMQRVAIASALSVNCDIILLDEPTSGLDYRHMMDIADILKKLCNQGKTIIVATHDSEFIENCCSRKLVLDYGGNE
ncbi:MAG: energy-coupling factor ABC transporter ATP-binding protein [Parasporobacterium sp.]|nr:energy-coupling factor ABC transporter ATP-binding protein [Parasporobacterium sp.]